jgi:glycosyltransferase involved in cell wall biosynthesis
MSTVTVALAIWGEDYLPFLPGWWDAVAKLQRKPDRIVLGLGREVFGEVWNTIPDDVEVHVFPLVSENHGAVWNAIIDECETDWLCICPADDRLTPEALNDVDNAGDAELIVDNIQYLSTGNIWYGTWDFSKIRTDMPMPQLAIARKSLYERVGGIREDIRWQDWAFYIDAFLANAVIYRSDIVRLIYDEGLNHVTESGRSLNPAVRTAANEELVAYAVSRGL